MSRDIKHDGIIESIEGRHVKVSIVQATACASCKIASQCNASESKVKTVDVYTDPTGFQVGQSVVVCTTGSVAYRALLMGFGLPLLLLLSVLIAGTMVGMGEDTAGLMALASLLPYYLTLWLFRNRVARRVSFRIEA
jgi:sigma-E factor negative regulatory protein RseC